MILKSIHITCTPDADPSNVSSFIWREGDDLFSLECAITKLQEFVDNHKAPAPVDIALANSLPLDINPS